LATASAPFPSHQVSTNINIIVSVAQGRDGEQAKDDQYGHRALPSAWHTRGALFEAGTHGFIELSDAEQGMPAMAMATLSIETMSRGA